MGNIRGWASGLSVMIWKVYVHLREGGIVKGEGKKGESKMRGKLELNRKKSSQKRKETRTR